jgi:SSS family solute:Na+ symporter
MTSASLRPVDYFIIGAYFLTTLLVGYTLRKRMVSTTQFFLAGRGLPAIITGIAFVSANCGAIEIMGMVSTSAKYGVRAAHFYWVGAIPAMLFLALFMMPIYYCCKVRSVPEFLKLRFDERTRIFNATSFAAMMMLVSGISLYAMAIVLSSFLGWGFTTSVFASALIVLCYVSLGGLTATIYNEVLQFLLIVLGFAPLAWYSLREFHGWAGLSARLAPDLRHAWKGMPVIDPTTATMDGVGAVIGLGFVLSFGYWCTDFLLIQRGLAARNVGAAVATPLIGSVVKLFFPAIVVLPGLAAAALFPGEFASRYDLALPSLMSRYYRPGLMGLGVTAMLASFMSGMAGNITAFNTVFTYDLYQVHLAPRRSDLHYLRVGRITTIVATVASIATAYLVLSFNNLMDYVQLLFSFFNAPLFATFLLGMFTTWATPWGAFAGLVSGTCGSLIHYLLYRVHWLPYSSDMTANFYGAICGWTVCFCVTCVVSAFTDARKPEELAGLVRTGDNAGSGGAWSLRAAWAASVMILTVAFVLNWIFF